MRWIWCFLLVASASVNVVECQVYASVVDLVRPLEAEKDVINALKVYVELEAKRLAEITETIQAMEESNAKVLANPEQNLNNIIGAFKTIARFTSEWDAIKGEILSPKNNEKLEDVLDSLTSEYPQKTDLKFASDSIFRLQNVYNFTPEQFANGSLTHDTLTMSAQDCYRVAEVAFEHLDSYQATLWFEQALTLSKAGDESINRGKIYDMLIFAYFHGKIPENLGRIVTLCREWVRFDPDSALAKGNLNRYSQKLDKLIDAESARCHGDEACKRNVSSSYRNRAPVFQRVLRDWEKKEDYVRFETLCRGENVYTSHDLSCSYRSFHPLHVLLPLKEEVFMKDPFIAVYHDFISDKEMDKLKELGSQYLQNSVILGPDRNTDKVPHIRTSKTAWIGDDLHPLVKQVTMRSITIGNLSHLSCDKMQVVCYGIGGHYNPHYDWMSDEDFGPELGDRVATTVHYLSDFDGGSTAFIDAGVRIPPKKGASLFWWNLHKNLKGDERNKHAGCPVIYGNKWIANKWVHRMDQLFARPCSTDPNE